LLADAVPVAVIQGDTNKFNTVNETDGLNPQFVNVDHELEIPQGQEGPIPSYALPQADKDPNITGIATLSTQILFFFFKACVQYVWGKILETIYSTFFPWCCFPYVHFC
jgi:hypothetical protein